MGSWAAQLHHTCGACSHRSPCRTVNKSTAPVARPTRSARQGAPPPHLLAGHAQLRPVLRQPSAHVAQVGRLCGVDLQLVLQLLEPVCGCGCVGIGCGWGCGGVGGWVVCVWWECGGGVWGVWGGGRGGGGIYVRGARPPGVQRARRDWWQPITHLFGSLPCSTPPFPAVRGRPQPGELVNPDAHRLQ